MKSQTLDRLEKADIRSAKTKQYGNIYKELRGSELLTVGKAADYLNCTMQTVQKMADEGLVKYQKGKKDWRLFKKEDLDKAKARCLILRPDGKGDRYILRPIVKATPRQIAIIRRLAHTEDELAVVVEVVEEFLGVCIVEA